jgi:hypothetical protein
VAHVQHTGVVQNCQRRLAAFDVQLISRLAREGALAVGPQLRLDTEITQKAERAAGDGGVADVEMQRELSATAQMEPPGGMEDT